MSTNLPATWTLDDMAAGVDPRSEAPAMRPRKATIYAEAITVMCPSCRDVVPDPDQESEFWTIEQLKKATGTTRECVCGTPVLIHCPQRVSVL